ncbi:hypothetical protein F383_23496 [Gossypium arboreum]|uniref:Uncharacterized protein n=1 Tax=Gossypium arboreum TaxID=29729 RepID=A0A0B0NRU3_GOSAR|nr:hypothetical protein F383_23496 [Gossypium arboreum]
MSFIDDLDRFGCSIYVNYLFERFHVTIMSGSFFSSLIIELHFFMDKR